MNNRLPLAPKPATPGSSLRIEVLTRMTPEAKPILLAASDEPATQGQLRQFGWCVSLVLAVVAWRQASRGTWLPWQFAAGSIFALATVWPATLRLPHRALAAITFPLRWVLSYVLLAVVYYGLVTPLGLWQKLCGRDALESRLDPKRSTYWRPRAKVSDLRRYGRQF